MRRRVASFLASATEIVVELGLEDRLVAISHECDFPDRILDRPRVSRVRFDTAGLDSEALDRAVRDAMARYGSVYEVDSDTLAAVRPDLVLTQAVCEVCAVPTPGVRDVVRDHGIPTDVLSLDAHTIEEILHSILDVGRALGAQDRAAELVDSLRTRIRRVERAAAGAPRPRVLAIEWLDPPFAPGHWVPEMIRIAAGDNLAGLPGRPSETVPWSRLESLDPDVLIIMPCGYGLDASRADADRHADMLHRVAPRAIAARRAFVVDGSAFFNRSGPRVVTGVEILAGLLHPDRFVPPSPETALPWP